MYPLYAIRQRIGDKERTHRLSPFEIETRGFYLPFHQHRIALYITSTRSSTS